MTDFNQLVRHSGNNDLFTTIQMAIVSHANGYPIHFHVEGLRGTGKTTTIRAARQIMPTIERIKGCVYNCDPKQPHCPQHFNCSREEVLSIGTESIPMPFLEISHSAKIGTVVGSIDLGKLTQTNNPEAALLPGILPRAHRGIVFIDEINRLADTSPELADVLLDVMGTKPGWIQIEESGLESVSMPILVSIWAASNPDEEPGSLEEIRRQLSDRFDYTVQMRRPKDVEIVTNILNNNRWDRTLQTNREAVQETMDIKYPEQLKKQIEGFPEVKIDPKLQRKLAQLYLDYDLESLRGLEAVQIGGQIVAALNLRSYVEAEDLKSILPQALSHRVDSLTLGKMLRSFEELEEFAEDSPDLEDKKSPSSRIGDKRVLNKYLDKSKIMLSVLNWIQKILRKRKMESDSAFRESEKRTISDKIKNNGNYTNFLNPLEMEVKEFGTRAIPLSDFKKDFVSTAEDLEKEKEHYLTTGEVQ